MKTSTSQLDAFQRSAVRRIRRRYVFFGHFLLSMLAAAAVWLFTYQWFYENINYDLEGFTHGIGSSFYNARIISLWVVIGALLIAHLLYVLYHENLDRALKPQGVVSNTPDQEKPKRMADLTDDGELIFEDEYPQSATHHNAST